MNTRLSWLHPLSWALWVKFLVGISVGLLIVGIPTFILHRQGIYAIGEQNARATVTQIGVRHAVAVSSALAQARSTLDTFVSDEDNQKVLVGYLLRDVRAGTDYLLPTSDEQVAETLRAGLLNPAAASFDSVRLLDRNGQALLNVTVNAASFEPVDESQSAAFREIQSAQLLGQSSALAVSPGDTPVVELVNTVYWRDGRPLGYVVTVLSNSRIFTSNLRVDNADESFSAYTFLTTPQRAVIAPAAVRDRALLTSRSLAVDNAIAGQSGTANYFATGSSSNGGTTASDVPYIGYFTPIGGTPFVLVTQAPADVVYNNALEFFQMRSLVVVGGLVVLIVALALIFNQMITPALLRLRRANQALSEGNFDFPVQEARRGDEIGALASSFVNMRDQVRTLLDDLENRVAVRTRDINATQDISRFATSQRDLQTLMDRVVDLIVERFTNIYHAQIFLIDEEGRDAVLRSSTGEAGRQLLSRGHRLGIGSLSVIGQVTQQGRLIVARDAAISQVHRRNEFLPDTRAELAIPLRVGETIIGALDVQSTIRDAFDDDQIAVLQTMADQIAIAIQNVLLYQESVQRVAQIEEDSRDATRRAWREFIHDQRMDALVSEAGFATEYDITDLRRQAVARGELVVGQPTERNTVPLAVPVILRGQVLGAVEWEIPAQSLSEEKLELAKELVSRLALSLDNARLFQESQRATERERLVNTIAAKLTAQTTINDILQTAVREVGQALRAPQVSIHLQGTAANDGSGKNGNGSNGNGAHHAAADH